MRRRVGLTVATLLALAVLVSLGTWQVRRLAWKEDLLARIEASRTAPVVPIGEAELRLRDGANPEWMRVSVRCLPTDGEPYVRYGLSEGEIAWRAVAPCRYDGGAPDSVTWIDRGVLNAGRGETVAPAYALSPPVEVIGVVRHARSGEDAATHVGVGALSDYTIAAERETPPPEGVTPEPAPPQISNNHLGYAITWYGLAAALVGVYVAMLLGDRRRSRAS